MCARTRGRLCRLIGVEAMTRKVRRGTWLANESCACAHVLPPCVNACAVRVGDLGAAFSAQVVRAHQVARTGTRSCLLVGSARTYVRAGVHAHQTVIGVAKARLLCAYVRALILHPG